MPIVRRADRQVGIAPIPGARTSAAATEASEGVGVDRDRADKLNALGGFGDRVARVGIDRYTRIQTEARDVADQTAGLAYHNGIADWESARVHDPQTGALTVKGKAALGLVEEVLAEFDTVTATLDADLFTDRQRLAAAQIRSQKRQVLDLKLRRHVETQINAWRAGELDGVIANGQNAAILAALDPKLVAVELETVVSAIRTIAPTFGHGPEAIARQVGAARSEVHVGVIRTLLAQDKDQQAATHLEAHREEIAGDKLDDVLAAVEEGSLRGQAQQAADAIVAAGGTFAEQRAKVKAITDPKLRDQVDQRVEQEAAIRDRAEREADEAAMRDGYDILDKTNDLSRIPPAMWAKYNGATRSAMRGYLLRATKGEPIETDLPTYYALMQQAGTDPATFATSNLLEHRASLGPVEFKQLAGLQLSLRKNDTAAAEKELAGFRTKSEVLDDTLIQFKINPNPKPDSPDAQRIARLRRLVDQQVDVLQEATGRKVTNQDLQSIVDGLLMKSVNVPGSWWNVLPGGKSVSDTRRPLLDLRIGDVPADVRAELVTALQDRGRPVSDQTILDLALELQSRGVLELQSRGSEAQPAAPVAAAPRPIAAPVPPPPATRPAVSRPRTDARTPLPQFWKPDISMPDVSIPDFLKGPLRGVTDVLEGFKSIGTEFISSGVSVTLADGSRHWFKTGKEAADYKATVRAAGGKIRGDQ